MPRIRTTQFAYAISMFLMLEFGHADVTLYGVQSEWEQDVGAFTFIDFTGFPEYTIITEQYSDLGIHFTDGTDEIALGSAYSDGAGLFGGSFLLPTMNHAINLKFDEPIHAIAADIGDLIFYLYDGDELIYESPLFGGGFVGLLSSESFNKVMMVGTGHTYIDNLYFQAIPGPGSGVLLLVSSALWRKRGRM